MLVAHLNELKKQADEQLAVLAACRQQLDPCAHQHHDRAVKLISKAHKLLEMMLQDPDLADPAFATNFYIASKGIREGLSLIEDGLVLALNRFSAADARLTRLIKLITTEMNWPYNAPLGSAISTMHYYTIPANDLIFAPSLESLRLLSISDIYHELAHFCCARDVAAMKLAAAIASPLSQIAAQAMQQSWPKATVDLFTKAMQRWLADWKVEFACDLIATFCLGPAYAWTNLRLCFARGDVFMGVDTHPADHARQIAIEQILEKLGFANDVMQVHAAWNEMLKLSNQTKPQSFDVEYPPTVIEAVVDAIHGYCNAKKLAPYDAGKQTVATQINRAWVQFLHDPANFYAWEANTINELDRRLPT